MSARTASTSAREAASFVTEEVEQGEQRRLLLRSGRLPFHRVQQIADARGRELEYVL